MGGRAGECTCGVLARARAAVARCSPTAALRFTVIAAVIVVVVMDGMIMAIMAIASAAAAVRVSSRRQCATLVLVYGREGGRGKG